MKYRGRIAPTPSGWLHLGHASTFAVAVTRARATGGTVVYRTEDIDPARCRPEFAEGAMADLRWWGLDWDEGPDRGGACLPYVQSERLDHYREAFRKLRSGGHIYPSPHSRKCVQASDAKPSPIDGDLLFPPGFRQDDDPSLDLGEANLNWRFRVPDGREITFRDGRTGEHVFVAGRDFGDFIIWKRDGFPSYELAVVVDDHAMEITEVVRGEDLLLSTARQLLLYESLGFKPPEWYHCALVEDPKTGRRMSKTRKSLALRDLRQRGFAPGRPTEYYLQGAV
ncbi:MAG: glutamate--tRNA ligase family protein [Opitutales bacterium]|jgi:glutamyl/glutaminyl-tRNA synthetase